MKETDETPKGWMPTQFADSPEFRFKGLNDTPSVCRARLFLNRATETIVAVVTEIADNEGTSVTNSAASLAQALCGHYCIEPTCFVLIEHYPAESGEAGTFDESYSRVNLDYDRHHGFRRIDWSPLTPEAVAELTGTPVEEWLKAPAFDEEDEAEAVEA